MKNIILLLVVLLVILLLLPNKIEPFHNDLNFSRDEKFYHPECLNTSPDAIRLLQLLMDDKVYLNYYDQFNKFKSVLNEMLCVETYLKNGAGLENLIQNYILKPYPYYLQNKSNLDILEFICDNVWFTSLKNNLDLMTRDLIVEKQTAINTIYNNIINSSRSKILKYGRENL